MRHYNRIACILLILPIINFTFAIPIIAVQETGHVSGDVAPDVTITMSAKRGDEMEKQWDTCWHSLAERVFRNELEGQHQRRDRREGGRSS